MAAGEAASASVPGANRPGATSLLDLVVFDPPRPTPPPRGEPLERAAARRREVFLGGGADPGVEEEEEEPMAGGRAPPQEEVFPPVVEGRRGVSPTWRVCGEGAGGARGGGRGGGAAPTVSSRRVANCELRTPRPTSWACRARWGAGASPISGSPPLRAPKGFWTGVFPGG